MADFLIPEIARKRYEQLINAGGSGNDIDAALDLLGDDSPRLTKLQREKLYDNASDGTKKSVDKYLADQKSRIAKRKAKGLAAPTKLNDRFDRLIDKWLITDRLKTEWWDSPEKKNYDSRVKYTDDARRIGGVDPKQIFPDNRSKGGAISGIQGAADKMREINIRDMKGGITDTASQPVVQAGEFKQQQQQLANKLRNDEAKAAQRVVEDAPIPKASQADLAKELRADKIKKLGMKVVPKLGAVLGGPIGWGVAAASTMMDAKDAYALGESTMNPESEEEKMRQHYLAELMRRNEVP